MTLHVALEDGPLDGWWYAAGDWDTTRTAAVQMGRTKHDVQGTVLGYEETDRTVSHKRMANTSAKVWRWKP